MNNINLSQRDLTKLELLGQGAEANVYKWNNKVALKIFRKKIDIDRKEKKIDMLINTKGIPENVVKPISKVYVDGEFLGYSMKMIKDSKCLRELIDRENINKMYFSSRDLLNLLIKIGDTIDSLHKNDIIVGDLNDANIILKNGTPYFIDVDSYGLGKELKPDAYTDEFFDPNKIDEKNNRIDFSKDTDLYSYAILSFYICTGIHPYGGYYYESPNMSLTERMKYGISILGKRNIRIIENCTRWDWMGQELEDEFFEIFELGKRENIVSYLKNLKNKIHTFSKKNKIWKNRKKKNNQLSDIILFIPNVIMGYYQQKNVLKYTVMIILFAIMGYSILESAIIIKETFNIFSIATLVSIAIIGTALFFVLNKRNSKTYFTSKKMYLSIVVIFLITLLASPIISIIDFIFEHIKAIAITIAIIVGCICMGEES